MHTWITYTCLRCISSDAGPYNAAKHGMGLSGGSERRQIGIDGVEVFRRDGAVIDWLAAWPLEDPERPPKWTRASRLFLPEATIAMISVATNLMKSIWIRGRARHLGEPWEDVFSPPAPAELLGAFGVRHPVLADWYEPLPSTEDDPHTLIVQTRHIGPPEPTTWPRTSDLAPVRTWQSQRTSQLMNAMIVVPAVSARTRPEGRPAPRLGE